MIWNRVTDNKDGSLTVEQGETIWTRSEAVLRYRDAMLSTSERAVERDFRKEPDAQDHAELEAMRSRWTIGERVRINDGSWEYASTAGFPEGYSREGTVTSIDFRYHGGCGFFPMIWVAPDSDPSDPCEWDEDELDRL